jgi:hypothetical protein
MVDGTPKFVTACAMKLVKLLPIATAAAASILPPQFAPATSRSESPKMPTVVPMAHGALILAIAFAMTLAKPTPIAKPHTRSTGPPLSVIAFVLSRIRPLPAVLITKNSTRDLVRAPVIHPL